MALRQLISTGRTLIGMAALAAGLFASTPRADAQIPSLEAFQGIYAGNYGYYAGLDGNGGANSASNPYTGSVSFTGLDSAGNTQTMTYSGTAYSYASYGYAHVYGSGTVTNPYFSAANTPLFDTSGQYNSAGSPDLLAVHGNAGWSDTFTYTGFQGTGYKVNYYFKLDGNVSGDVEAGLNFYTSDPNAPYFGPRTSAGSALWISPWYDVNWGVPFNVFADFYGGMTTYVSTKPEGVGYSATADYSNTLTLAGVEIVGPDGKPVTGWSLDAASGTAYPLIQPSSVPEPGCLALLAGFGTVGAGVLLRRRR